jgi:hypothetical protein
VTEHQAPARPGAAADVARARLAISGIYLVVGLMLGTWFARLPDLRVQLGLSYSELGSALLAQMIGVIVAMQLAEPLFTRFGGARVVRLGAVIVPWFLPLLAVVHGAGAATGGLFAWGLAAGALDVGMNAGGVRTERLARRPILNGLHAVWGAGALAGALLTALAVRADLAPRAQFLIVAVALSAIAAASGRHLLADDPAQVPPAGAAIKHRGTRSGLAGQLRDGWTAAVIVLGVLGAAEAIAETSVSSWCGIFLTGQRAAPASLAPLGYTAFIAAETGTRLIGDRLHRRWGPVLLVRIALAVTVAGLVAVIVTPSPLLDIAGFAVQGCGIAVLAPIITGAAGHGGAREGTAASLAIARFSTFYYAGAMAGPALTGWLAQELGLAAAFGLLIAPLAVIGVLAAAVKPAGAMRDPT